MQTWISFLISLFWISVFCSLFSLSNFVKLLFLSECIWILLFQLSLLTAVNTDELTLLSLSLFILAFAGLEFSIGILLIHIFKKLTKHDTFNENILTKVTYKTTPSLSFL